MVINRLFKTTQFCTLRNTLGLTNLLRQNCRSVAGNKHVVIPVRELGINLTLLALSKHLTNLTSYHSTICGVTTPGLITHNTLVIDKQVRVAVFIFCQVTTIRLQRTLNRRSELPHLRMFMCRHRLCRVRIKPHQLFNDAIITEIVTHKLLILNLR